MSMLKVNKEPAPMSTKESKEKWTSRRRQQSAFLGNPEIAGNKLSLYKKVKEKDERQPSIRVMGTARELACIPWGVCGKLLT